MKLRKLGEPETDSNVATLEPPKKAKKMTAKEQVLEEIGEAPEKKTTKAKVKPTAKIKKIEAAPVVEAEAPKPIETETEEPTAEVSEPAAPEIVTISLDVTLAAAYGLRTDFSSHPTDQDTTVDAVVSEYCDRAAAVLEKHWVPMTQEVLMSTVKSAYVVGSRHIADAIISKVQEIQAELRKPSEKKEDEKATETVDAEAPKAEIVNDAKKPSVFSRLKSALKTPFVSVKQSHSESSNRKEVVSALREDLLTLGELRRLYNWNDLLFTSEQLDAKYGVERPGRPKSTDKIEEKAEEKAAA